MGCIEMTYYKKFGISPDRLIETWDVLKLPFVSTLPVKAAGLIETWDVLK